MIARKARSTQTRDLYLLVVLSSVILAIKIFSLKAAWIEKYYSTGIFPGIGRILRIVFGWIPVSIGDILYAAMAVYLLVKLIKYFKVISRRNGTRIMLWYFVRKMAITAAIIYIIFNVFWGLNYNRQGIGKQLQLSAREYTTADLQSITNFLRDKTNANRIQLGSVKYPSYPIMFAKAIEAYGIAHQKFSFIAYSHSSIKRSLYGRGGNYFGFLGYYNPFTGESQLNLTQPRFLIPFVICHEMAHQLGYANESEANFVGYITATQSPDPLFKYSTYFDMFNYANHELAIRDSMAARNNYQLLDTLVKQDYVELRNFYKKYKNPVEPFVKTFYDQFLKANQQDKGLESYNQVTGLLIAYYKKYGTI